MDSHEKTPTSQISRVTRRTLLRRAGIGTLAAGLAVAQGSRALAFGEQPAPVLPATRYAVAAVQTLQIDVVDDRPVPPEVSVPVGTAVAWINRGADWRIIAALDGSFDSGKIAPGGVFTHRFAERGSYRYLCEHHAIQGVTGRIDVK
jgi:plastocyanin